MAIICGRWLIQAHSRSWRSASIVMTRAPIACNSCRYSCWREVQGRSGSIGVISHTASRNRLASACSMPPTSLPAMGCPGSTRSAA